MSPPTHERSADFRSLWVYCVGTQSLNHQLSVRKSVFAFFARSVHRRGGGEAVRPGSFLAPLVINSGDDEHHREVTAGRDWEQSSIMNKNMNSPSKLTEFAPLSPEESQPVVASIFSKIFSFAKSMFSAIFVLSFVLYLLLTLSKI